MKNRSLQIAILQTLKRIDTPEALKAVQEILRLLVEALKAEPGWNWQVAEVLGEIADPFVVPALIDAMLAATDGDMHVPTVPPLIYITLGGLMAYFGEPLWSDLIDFCKASYDLPKTRVVRRVFAQAAIYVLAQGLSHHPCFG